MAKVKLTKGELKKQRDALRQYRRYLPTLQLKKQQLQAEILRQAVLLEEKERSLLEKKDAMGYWLGLLAEQDVNLPLWVKPGRVLVGSRNIAGITLPVFERIEFAPAEYDLFIAPLWVDEAIAMLRQFVALREEINVAQKGVAILREELRITTQRVNLFEKIKIPFAQEAIRIIKIYLGDQMTNAVGRSKIAKRKLEEVQAQEALAL